MAEQEKIPLIGLFTGAQMLYEPRKHCVLNVRASYYDQTREQIEKLWSIDQRKIGVIYRDDGFGKAVLDGSSLHSRSTIPARWLRVHSRATSWMWTKG
jgi:branched-chain amino acid transport system substrate-binding protein